MGTCMFIKSTRSDKSDKSVTPLPTGNDAQGSPYSILAKTYPGTADSPPLDDPGSVSWPKVMVREKGRQPGRAGWRARTLTH